MTDNAKELLALDDRIVKADGTTTTASEALSRDANVGLLPLDRYVPEVYGSFTVLHDIRCTTSANRRFRVGKSSVHVDNVVSLFDAFVPKTLQAQQVQFYNHFKPSTSAAGTVHEHPLTVNCGGVA